MARFVVSQAIWVDAADRFAWSRGRWLGTHNPLVAGSSPARPTGQPSIRGWPGSSSVVSYRGWVVDGGWVVEGVPPPGGADSSDGLYSAPILLYTSGGFAAETFCH